MGRNIRFVNSGRHPQAYFTQMWQSILSGSTWQGEIINRKKNGEEYWEQATISPIKNANGKITHFVALKDDITERKRLEKQLRGAKERAESSTRAKSAFLANMSHEIRTPMNAIIGYIELALATNELSDEIGNYLKTARRSSKSLLALINDILDISKMETGKLEVEKHKFYLPRLLHGVLQALQLTIQEKNIELLLQISPDLHHCLIADSNRLRQVLMNLVGNAIKFTNQGRVKIEVKDNDNGFILFCVADTGIGIPPSQIENLFQPFTQGDESTARRYGGTGLGTTLCRQLLTVMGGKIWVESDVGKGTRVYFTIPKEIPDCTANCYPGCEEHEEPDEIVTACSTRRLNILSAEDIDDAAVHSQIDRLLASIHRAEVDETLLSDTVSLLRGHIEDGMIREMTHALENFDFEKAIKKLRRISKCVKKEDNKSVE